VRRDGGGSALTQAAGDDIGAVLREDKGIDQRQIHALGRRGVQAQGQGHLKDGDWDREESCSAGSIFGAGAAIHARLRLRLHVGVVRDKDLDRNRHRHRHACSCKGRNSGQSDRGRASWSKTSKASPNNMTTVDYEGVKR
jgi:hypothetical protein